MTRRFNNPGAGVLANCEWSDVERLFRSLASAVGYDGDDIDELQGRMFALLFMGRERPRLQYENAVLRDTARSLASHQIQQGARIYGERLVDAGSLLPQPKQPPPYDPKDN